MVCVEGESEENYLYALRKKWGFQRELLDVVPCRGTDPLSLVKAVKARRDELRRCKAFDPKLGDTAWAVFDVDEHRQQDPERFSQAIILADANKIELALSNPNFELWVAQHRVEVNRNYHRDKMKELVCERIPDYRKNYPTDGFVKNVVDLTDDALGRANALAARNSRHPYNQERFNNPSTHMHRLVLEIQTLRK